MRFIPKQAFFEPQALEYPLGQSIYDRLTAMAVPVAFTSSHNRVPAAGSSSQQQAFRDAKQTLVVGVRRSPQFAACKPSAHYQLPLATSCPGMCEYCYLATSLGKRPYVRVYVNTGRIFEQTAAYIAERAPAVTTFEGAAVSDPVPTEYLTGLLRQAIEFFADQELGRFRFVTKFTDIDSLLPLRHNGHTRFRFSLNAPAVITKYEHLTPAAADRAAAAAKVAAAGYPLGFIVAPIIAFPGWQEEYERLFETLHRQLAGSACPDLTFEFISHRFTKRAKNQILDLFARTDLPLDETERRFKYGQFGYGKYLYPQDLLAEIKEHMLSLAGRYFPAASVDYII
ncbi:MAG: spore photoproduct lyase [Sporomusaceae bacterium]|nr:spore photoproduct lyase [Sporomusaceae bacterium]